MPDNFFQKLIKKSKGANINLRTQESQTYFRNQIKRLSSPGAGEILRTSKKKRSQVAIGRMYFMRYDPKGKKTLPFYDRFPLIFPIETQGDSFLGLNIHYLPPTFRAVLLDRLMSLSNDKKFNTRTKLKISYDILKAASKFKLFKPTIKRYLNNHVRSAFIEIPSDQWEIAIFLPVADFKKKSNRAVWADSRTKI